ncbi:DNA polymerase III subunit delta' [Alteromonadaceae bacterium M269]|nr:DNA polymerase III subunit delta' [Alteromonadaceae bacterium M269]
MFPWFNAVYQPLVYRYLNKQLHHGLLVCAQSGAGKTQFATKLAAKVLCQSDSTEICGQCQACALFDAGTHPDFIQILPEKTIGIDAIRQAIQTLNATSYLSGAKVLVIHQAHLMTVAAANALLKTLEEPTENTYLFLLTESPQQLLPTVLSRVEKVNLPSGSQAEVINWLNEQGVENIEPEVLGLYSGAPLNLLDMLKDEDAITYQTFNEDLNALVSRRKSSKELADQWQTQVEQMMTWIQHWIKSNAINNAMPDALWDLYQQCSVLKEKLKNPGINKQLQLANFLQSIQQSNLQLN